MKDQDKTIHLFRRLGAIAVPASIVIMAILALLDIRAVFEPRLLLFILNTLFFSVVGFVVAYIAARGYVAGGSLSLLLLGCGVLALGSGGLVAGRLIGPPGGPNVNVTIFNTGALSGAAFHIVGAILTSAGVTSEKVTKRRKSTVMLAYLGVLVFVALLTIASLQGAIPPFFIQGVGPTLLRQVVLGTAAALFAMSSLLFMILYSKSRSEFLYWYSLALALIAVGLSAVFLQKAVGSPIGWAGRSAQYLGGIYFIIAVLTAIRGARAKGIPLEKAIADFLRQAEEHYRALVETVPDAIISCDHEGRVLLWNSAAERMFGYSRGEAVGSLLIDLIAPDRHADNLRQEMEKFAKTGKSPLIGKATEIEAKRKNGEVFPVELSVSVRKTADGWVSTIIVRDITERKRAEEEIKQRNEELAALNAIATVVSQSLNLDEILNSALDEVLELVHLDVGGIYLADRERRKLDLVVHRGISKEFAHAIGSLSVDEKTLEAVMAEGKFRRFILSVKAVLKDRVELKRILSAIKTEELSLACGVPVLLQAKDDIQGLMIVASHVPRQFSEAELRLLTSIGQEVAIAIQNARLYDAVKQELAERKRAEEALRGSEARYRTLIEKSADGIVIVDGNGMVRFINPAAEALFGREAEELLGALFGFLVVADEAPELDIVRRGGERAVAEMRVVEMKWEGETAYLASLRDITKRKRAEEELQQSYVKL